MTPSEYLEKMDFSPDNCTNTDITLCTDTSNRCEKFWGGGTSSHESSTGNIFTQFQSFGDDLKRWDKEVVANNSDT